MCLSPVVDRPQALVLFCDRLRVVAPPANVVVSVTSSVSVFWKNRRVSNWSTTALVGVHRCDSCSVLRLVSLSCLLFCVMVLLSLLQP